MSTGLRATARLLGLSHSYLAKRAAEGAIPRNADRTFDAEAVRTALRKQTDQAMVRKERPPKPVTGDHGKPVTTPDDARAAIALVVKVLTDEGVVPDGEVDFAKAKLAEKIMKVREQDLRVAERRKILVPLAAVTAHVAKSFLGFRKAIEAMPSRYVAEIAARLGCDPAVLDAELQRMIHATLTEMSAPVVRG